MSRKVVLRFRRTWVAAIYAATFSLICLGGLAGVAGPVPAARIMGGVVMIAGGLGAVRGARAATLILYQQHVVIRGFFRSWRLSLDEIKLFGVRRTQTAFGQPRDVLTVDLKRGSVLVFDDFQAMASNRRQSAVSRIATALNSRLAETSASCQQT